MTVLEAYRVINGNTVWVFTTKRNLNDWEVAEFEDLMSTLESVQLLNNDDQMVWNLEKIGIFSVTSYYKFLTDMGAGRQKFLLALLFSLGRRVGKKSSLWTG